MCFQSLTPPTASGKLASKDATTQAGEDATKSDLPDGVAMPAKIIRSAAEVGTPLKCTGVPTKREIVLEAKELDGYIDGKATYRYWTFDGKVPAPFLRVCEGDEVYVRLKNHKDSEMLHSVDFHAVTGSGGGASFTADTEPGKEQSFTFKALNPGVFVYHCATPPVAQHLSKGQYGLLFVQPKEGLPPVDREFYIMQGELFAKEASPGKFEFDYDRMVSEHPSHFVFNGAVRALTGDNALKAKVGETIRIYFGVGGPNEISSFHVIGLIFDRVYNLGSLSSPPLKDVQSVVVPTGGVVVVEVKLKVPGKYTIVDHSLSRAEKGLVGHLVVEGPENPEIYRKGKSNSGL